ncbi:MAG TPA: APC family permease [Terriglobales bacterium]|jgi:amino acid transporter
MQAEKAKRRAPIGTLGLLALIFLTVSGGPYGLEPMVASIGGRATLALLLVVPVLWSLPIALMAAELASALPLLGGYYQWVRLAAGDFWGFQEGWWGWLFTWVDMPLYPVLCGAIMRQGWPMFTGHALSNAATMAFVLSFIWLAAILNLRGARFISRYAMVSSVAVMAPFVALVLAAWWRAPAYAVPAAALGHASGQPLGWAGWAVALSTVMWNYAGWDNVATFAPDVHRPHHTYPRALFWGLVLITLGYVLPVAAGLHLDPVAAHWSNGYFVRLGALALGTRLAPAVALTMTLTAILSAWAQYTGQLLYVVPLPMSLAQDGFLPRWLLGRNRHGAAWQAVLVCTVLYSLFVWVSFTNLLALDVLFDIAGLSLEFVALWILRRRPAAATAAVGANAKAAAQHGEPPPFRIPLSGWKLLPVCCAPMGLAVAMLALAIKQQPRFAGTAVALLATGPLLYWFLSARRPAAVAAAGGSYR